MCSHLFGCQNGDLTQHFLNLGDRLLNILWLLTILSDNPHGTSEDLARFDLPESGDELFGNSCSEFGEFFDDFSDKGDNVDSRRVVGVTEEVHEDVDDVGGDFGETNGARVNALN